MLVRSPITGGGVSLGVAVGATLPFGAITAASDGPGDQVENLEAQTGVEGLVQEVAGSPSRSSSALPAQRSRHGVGARGIVARGPTAIKGTHVRIAWMA